MTHVVRILMMEKWARSDRRLEQGIVLEKLTLSEECEGCSAAFKTSRTVIKLAARLQFAA